MLKTIDFMEEKTHAKFDAIYRELEALKPSLIDR